MLGSPGSRHVDAITADQALADLTERVTSGSTGPVDVLDLAHFVERVLGKLTPVEHAASFLPETLALYDRALREPFDPSGLDPRRLENAASSLASLVEQSADDTPAGKSTAAIQKLQILCVCQYAIVESFDDVLRVLRLNERDVAPEPHAPEQTRPWLGNLLNIRFPQHAAWAEEVMAFISGWKESTEGTCRFPAVLDSDTGDGHMRQQGYVRQVELTLRDYARQEDEFSIAFATESDTDSYLDPAIAAGRTVLASVTPGAADKSYRGDYRLTRAGLAHAGHSAGLALASVFVCETQRFSGQRTRCRIQPGTVFTGAVDESGAIQDVASDSLSAKVEAVFFSPARRFVLPEKHVDAAEQVVLRLRERYPRRNLLMLGKKTLTDVFSDRRVISIAEIGRIRHGAARFWRRKWAVSSLATALLFIALAFAGWWYVMDQHPAGLEVTAEGVRLTNVNQRVLWSKGVNRETVAFHQRRGSGHSYTALIDVNRDGYKDGFWIEYTEKESKSETIFSVDGRTLEPLWKPKSLELDVDYPFDVSISHGRMRPTTLLVEDLEGDGPFELVTALHHRSYYPAAILTLDARSGAVRGTYHHAGAFSVVTASDIDADGKKEIIAGGTNNAFNDAVVVVLDPDRLSGIGPARGDYRSTEPPTALEEHYIKFPRTSLARFAGMNSAFVSNIMVLEDDSMIRLSSRSIVLVTDTGERLPGGPTWEMDFSMRTVAMGTSDAFDAVYDIAREQGLFNGPLDNEFKLVHMGNIQRFTDRGWEPVPFSDRANLPPGYLGESRE